MGCVLAYGQFLDSILHVSGLIGCFPCVPCLCGRFEILPLVRGLQVPACFQYRVCRDEEEGCVRDRVITGSAFGFILGGLKCVYVLEDAFTVCLIFLHLIMEREDVNCVHSAVDLLEVVQQLPQGNLCKHLFLVLQFEEPRFVDRVEDQRV